MWWRQTAFSNGELATGQYIIKSINMLHLVQYVCSELYMHQFEVFSLRSTLESISFSQLYIDKLSIYMYLGVLTQIRTLRSLSVYDWIDKLFCYLLMLISAKIHLSICSVGPIDNKSPLVQVITWCLVGATSERKYTGRVKLRRGPWKDSFSYTCLFCIAYKQTCKV